MSLLKNLYNHSAPVFHLPKLCQLSPPSMASCRGCVMRGLGRNQIQKGQTLT